MLVAAPAAPAFDHDYFLVRVDEIGQHRTRIGGADPRTVRHQDPAVLTARPAAVGTPAGTAILGNITMFTAEGNQGIDSRYGFDDHVATFATIAAIGTAARN